MANSGLFPSGWGPKQYILAAVAGTLAASAVVIVASVVLSPARIAFSVTGASSSPDSGGDLLNFTLAAANPSHRAGVEYCSVTAKLRLYSASNRVEWVQTTVLEDMPLLQPPGSSQNLHMSVFFEGGYVEQNFGAASVGGRGGRSPPMIVLVSAEVRFKVGRVKSRPYAVQVSCSPVVFFTGDNAAAASIRCVA